MRNSTSHAQKDTRHVDPPKFTLLLTASVALLLTEIEAIAQDGDHKTNWPLSAVVQTEPGHQIPARAYGVAYIDAARMATLLQLMQQLRRVT